MKLAVIGVGAMGKSHARVYASMQSVNLVGVCDADKGTVEQIAVEYKTKAYTDHRDLLAKEKPDAVSICVPTKFHKEVALDFIKKKVHVLIEKPIAADTKEAMDIIWEAEKNKVKLMIGHIERFNPVVLELKKRIQNNELGKIYKVHCRRFSPFPKRIVDVGVITDFAIHDIDVLKFLVGSKITRVYAETAQRIHSSHEDLLNGSMRFENDILGVINANWVTPKKVREISVTGEKGMFVANYVTQELYFYENKFTRQNLNYDEGFMNVVEGRKMKIMVGVKEPLLNELEAFIVCITEDTPAPISGEDGLHALQTAHLLLRSAKEHTALQP